ncbi:methionine ABC transporter permease [Bacillus testis]|uniref:methionine ABC transporter permease n=1 Tax=Bacillus testis TaxID=1622072 RepID=UPI00067E8B0B|nr:methionine ABC transporter permease [Bacillus testis]
MNDSFFQNLDWDVMWEATYETLFMSAISLLFVFIVGVALGLILFLTSKGNLWQNRLVYGIVGAYVNIFRSIPFIILIVLLIPFTKSLMGTMIGAKAALPALIIGTAPFYARMVEIALREIDKGVIEAAKAMGAKTSTIIWSVLLPEAKPAIISGITVTAIALIGSTAMAGVVGAGGLGNVAYLEGYQRGQSDVTLVATVITLVIVFIVQFIGDFFTRITDKR